MHATLTTIDHQKKRNSRTKKNVRVRKIIIFLPPLAIVEIEVSLAKLWVSHSRIILV